MIKLKNVFKIYGKKQNRFIALQDIDLEIKKGSIVAIVGKSGSGKSTLMHVMSGLDPATIGDVRIDNKDLKKFSQLEVDAFRSSYMSFIFQSFFIEANQTALQNVMLPLEIANVPSAKRRQKVEKALELVELTDKISTKARNLSGGQKQRLAIARAIVNNPKLIFADEPTGNLDSKTGDKITKILFDLNRKIGSTLVIVTHDEELAAKCDAQIYLKDGKIEKVSGKKGVATYKPAQNKVSPEEFIEKKSFLQKTVFTPLKKLGIALRNSVLFFVTFYTWPAKIIRYLKSVPKRWRHTKDLIGRSGRALRSAKARTILTALAISVGGFTLVLTLAAGNGLRKYTDQLVSSNFDPAELIVGRDREITNTGAPLDTPQEFDESVGTLQGGGQGNFQVRRVTDEDVAELRKNPRIEQVRENIQLSIRYVTREGQKRYTAGGEAYNPAQKPELKAGSVPESGDIQKGTILLPEGYISALGFANEQDAIGKVVSITVQQPFTATGFQEILSGGDIDIETIQQLSLAPKTQTLEYKIAGIHKRAATSLSFGVLPILFNSSDARTVYDFTIKGTPDYGKYLYVFARVADGEDDEKLQSVKTELEGQEYYVQTSKDIQKTITQFVNILQVMVGVFGMITVVASVFGVVNTQYISVLERTREIGMMKALGMSKKSINSLFIFEAAWIGFIGGMIGIIVGFILGKSMNPWLTTKLELGEGNSLLIFNLAQVLVLLVALMLVAALAGLFPAKKAAKLDPVEALRTE